jgi:hypothetical protein
MRLVCCTWRALTKPSLNASFRAVSFLRAQTLEDFLFSSFFRHSSLVLRHFCYPHSR